MQMNTDHTEANGTSTAENGDHSCLDAEMVNSILPLVLVDAVALRNGVIEKMNPTMAQWVEDTKGWTTAKGKDFWELFPVASSGGVREWYETLKERGDRYGILDIHLDRSNREDRWCRLSLLVCEERDLVLMEYSDRPSLMQQFEDMAQYVNIFKTYVLYSGIGLIILSNERLRQGVIMYASEEACRILQRSMDELVGNEFTELVDAKDARLFKSIFTECNKGRVMSFNESIKIRSPDGEDIILEAWMRPLEQDGTERMYLVFKDDTSRVLLLDELHRFATVFNKLNDTVIIADPGLKIMYVNPTGLVRTGYEFNELRGKPFTSLITSTGPETEIEGISKIMDERSQWTGEAWVKTKDGNDFPADVSVNRSTNGEGEPEAHIITIRDISHIKDLEMKILSSNEKTELFNELLVHDLMSFIEALLGGLDFIGYNQEDPSSREALERVKELTERMARLVSQVGALSKTRIPDPLRSLNLSDIINRTLRDIRTIYNDRPLEVEVTGLDDGIAIITDDLVHELFLNILDNAIKYNHHEIPYIGIHIEKNRGPEGNHIQVSVSDNGPGIVDEEKATVFYRFFRRFDGTDGKGLGLYLVKALVSRYHGKVWIEDRVPGRPYDGAKVVVSIPVASEHDLAEAGAKRPVDAISD